MNSQASVSPAPFIYGAVFSWYFNDMTKERAHELLNIYAKAWVTRDPELILTIFTPDATYNDPREALNQGHKGIHDYWVNKVVNGQKDIIFKLRNLWIDGDTVVVEWEAQFIDTIRSLRVSLEEVAIFTVKGDIFGGLREYYKSVKTPL